MIKKKILQIAAGILVITLATYFLLKPEPTKSLLEIENASTQLQEHWTEGEVIALIRHAERCDRSDNQCLSGDSGITVPGSEEAIVVGKKFNLLPESETIIYNSPVKRTTQTARFMFGDDSETQSWLRKGCKKNLYNDILKNKQDGQNLILVTHSTCIDKLGEEQNKKLVEMDIHDESTYNATIFLIANDQTEELETVGYLFAEDWDKAFN